MLKSFLFKNNQTLISSDPGRDNKNVDPPFLTHFWSPYFDGRSRCFAGV